MSLLSDRELDARLAAMQRQLMVLQTVVAIACWVVVIVVGCLLAGRGE